MWPPSSCGMPVAVDAVMSVWALRSLRLGRNASASASVQPIPVRPTDCTMPGRVTVAGNSPDPWIAADAGCAMVAAAVDTTGHDRASRTPN